MNNIAEARPPSLISKMAMRFSVDPDKLMTTLKATAFKVKDGVVSNEQMMALLVVADQYGLNPFTKEIYAFPDKQNGIVPVVGVDGWSRLINTHAVFDGIEFRWAEKIVVDKNNEHQPCPEWCEAVIYRKDRSHPTIIREYFDEVYRPPFKGKSRDGGVYVSNGPWQTHTKRMLRWKAMIQCSRVGMGYVGIYDEDEAARIMERDMGPAVVVTEAARAPRLRDQVKMKSDVTTTINAAFDVDSSDAHALATSQDRDLAETNAPTYAEIASRLQSATNQDDLDAAADLIGSIDSDEQRAELAAIYSKLSARGGKA